MKALDSQEKCYVIEDGRQIGIRKDVELDEYSKGRGQTPEGHVRITIRVTAGWFWDEFQFLTQDLNTVEYEQKVTDP